MTKTILALACATAFLGACADMGTSSMQSNAMPMSTAMGATEPTKMVGGAAMYPSKDIIDNAVNSKDHTTLVAAVKAAGLVDTLKGPGTTW